MSQGFPDFQADPELFEAGLRAMREGRNQYPPMIGVPELRNAMADKVESLYDVRYNIEQEITVTAGATQAIFTAIAAFVRTDDEVIVFAPFYDSYVPSIETIGGKTIYAELKFPRVHAGLGAGARIDYAANAHDHHQLAAQPPQETYSMRLTWLLWLIWCEIRILLCLQMRVTNTSFSTVNYMQAWLPIPTWLRAALLFLRLARQSHYQLEGWLRAGRGGGDG